MQQLQQLQQQTQEIEDYLQQVSQTQEQLEQSKQAVREVENIEEGSEILAPVGAGAYVVAEVKETDKVVSNIGGEVFEKKSNEDAAEILEKQITLVRDTQNELESQMQQIQEQMQQIQQEMQQE